MDAPRSFVELLYAEAPREAFDAVVLDAQREGLAGEELERLRAERVVALRVREQIERQRQRESELSALYETANDLTAIRDVDAILAAIVRRARSLLRADMTYLSLNDEAEGASYMKVTDGSVSAEFRNLRLPLGTGLLGLVAQTGAPYYTDDYQSDARFVHRRYIDHAVHDEGIRAILGVPLMLDGKVIGALLAGHRSVRPFPPSEVALLTSFAAHAAIALENARLFQQTRTHSEAVELAASTHDRLTDVLLRGGGVADVAAVLADVLDGSLRVVAPDGRGLAAAGPETRGPNATGAAAALDAAGLDAAALEAAVAEARASGRSVELADGTAGRPAYVAAALAGAEHLGTLLLHGRAAPLELAGRRTLERGALVTALVLLFNRSVAEAEERVRGELLADLLAGRENDPAKVRERARRQHADLDGPGAVAVADVDGIERHRAAQVAARLAGELRGLGGDHDGQVVLVAPGEDPRALGGLLHQRLVAAGARATVGVAGTDQAAVVAAAYAEARRCAATLHTLGRDGEVSDPEGLGLARLVLGGSGPEELAAFISAQVGPVLDYDARRGTALVATMEAWFAAGGRPAGTAERLHVHANTVTQRLDRISRLLGEDWRDPERALDLQMALRLRRLQG